MHRSISAAIAVVVRSCYYARLHDASMSWTKHENWNKIGEKTMKRNDRQETREKAAMRKRIMMIDCCPNESLHWANVIIWRDRHSKFGRCFRRTCHDFFSFSRSLPWASTSAASAANDEEIKTLKRKQFTIFFDPSLLNKVICFGRIVVINLFSFRYFF